LKSTEQSTVNRKETSRADVSKQRAPVAEPLVPPDIRAHKSEKNTEHHTTRTRNQNRHQDINDKKEYEQQLAKVISDAKEYIIQKDKEHAEEVLRLKREIEALTRENQRNNKDELTQQAIFDSTLLGAQEKVELAKIQGYLERQKEIEIAKLREETELNRKLEISLLREEAEAEKNEAILKIKEEAEKEKNAAISRIKEETEKRISSKFPNIGEEKEKERKAELAKLKAEFEKEKKIELAKLREEAQKNILTDSPKTGKTIAEYEKTLAETEQKYEHLKIKNEQLLNILSDKIIKSEEQGISSTTVDERKSPSEHKGDQKVMPKKRVADVAQKQSKLSSDLISTLILLAANLIFIFIIYPNITAWIDYVGLNDLTVLIRILITLLGAMISLFCFAKTRELSRRKIKNKSSQNKRKGNSIRFLVGIVMIGVALLGVFLFTSIFLFFLIGTALIILAALLVPDYT